MPVPASTERKAAELSPLGEHLLAILQSSHMWMTRKEIAAALGRPGDLLTPDEWRVLRELATDGFIAMGQRKVGAVKHEYIYKAK